MTDGPTYVGSRDSLNPYRLSLNQIVSQVFESSLHPPHFDDGMGVAMLLTVAPRLHHNVSP